MAVRTVKDRASSAAVQYSTRAVNQICPTIVMPSSFTPPEAQLS